MKEKTMETITAEERAAHIIDMCHRMTVHHTLWFREVEHQLGFEKALNVMDYAWKQTRKAAFVVWRRNFISLNKRAVPLSSSAFLKKISFLFWTPSQKAGLPRTASGFREWSFPTASMMRNGATILHGPGSLPLKRTPLKNFLAWKSIPDWKDWRRL